MTQLTHLTDLADAFMAVTDLKEITLSHRVFGDSKKLSAIRAGADITVGRFNLALRWFDESWPEAAVWPEHVSRPLTPERFDALAIASGARITDASAPTPEAAE